MFVKPKEKPNSKLNDYWCLPQPAYCQNYKGEKIKFVEIVESLFWLKPFTKNNFKEQNILTIGNC